MGLGPLLLDMVILSLAGGALLTIAALAECTLAQHNQRTSESRFRTIFEQAAVGMAWEGRPPANAMDTTKVVRLSTLAKHRERPLPMPSSIALFHQCSP